MNTWVTSRIGHFTQQGLQAQGVGCGVRGLDDAVHNAVLHGAEHADFAVEQTVQLMKQGHGRRLAVGARDGHHFHVAGGMVVESGGDVSPRAWALDFT